MADIKALKSYLVSLGFQVNQTQLTQFNNALKDATRLIETTIIPEMGALASTGVAVAGALVGVGIAAIATADKVAMRDQDFRLWGQTMFMDVQHARSLKIATEALGATLEQIAFDPELHRRFVELQTLQKTLTGQLGPNFEENMRRIRDIRFEFSKFSVEMQYFLMNVVSKIVEGLGGEKFLNNLQDLNAYIVQHIPEWSTMIANLVVPLLKLLKDIFIIIGGIAKVSEPVFNMLARLTTFVTGGTTKTVSTGAEVTSPVPIQDTGNIRALAAQVGGSLGINPALIYGQWEHETGNFTNRGARSLNNLAGIRYPGSTEYRAFSSLGEFGNYYTNLIRRKYPGAMGAQSAEQFAGALKRGGYFEDTLSHYTRGMQRGAGMYSGGGVNIGTINIMQPHATPEQIATQINERIKAERKQQTSYNLAELRSAY
jgi:hypothetical protein